METDHQLRILYLYQILLRHSDVDHPVSTKELIDMMETYHQIKLHRTTIPKYIELLNAGGLEVMEIRSREKKYYLNDRLFELPEVKLLIDAVQSSKFISAGKSQVLISKLMALTSEANAAKLKRNLYVTGRVKSDNEKSYYIVEAINDAINEGKRISFYYTDYNTQKERVLKNDGLPYVISPYALIWDGDFYYVLGLNHGRNQINTFRVEVSLLCENSLMKHLIDHFGLDVETETVDDNHFRARVLVCTSPTFYRWVFGWCGRMKIESPAFVLDEYHRMARAALE